MDKIIVGGHDWGGAVVWRIAQWYPNLVSHVFSVCTPYFSVHDQYVSTESLVKRGVPQFGYQLQFGSPDHKVEKVVTDETKMWKFLAGFYGGRPKSGKKFFIPKEGIDLSLIEEDEIGMTPLLNQEVSEISPAILCNLVDRLFLGIRLLCEGVYEEWGEWTLQLVSHPTNQLRR